MLSCSVEVAEDLQQTVTPQIICLTGTMCNGPVSAQCAMAPFLPAILTKPGLWWVPGARTPKPILGTCIRSPYRNVPPRWNPDYLPGGRFNPGKNPARVR